MNRSTVLAVVLTMSFAFLSASAQEDRVFKGEISDSQCAMNVHSLTRSHREMLKSKSMGGSAKDCTLYCVRYHGGVFVLSSKKDVYRLDDQGMAEQFAGQRVRVTGHLLDDNKTIHVAKIEAE
jgi:Protein of unknown function (DUF5818)